MPMNKYVLNSTPQKITDGTKLGVAQGMVKRDFTLQKVQQCQVRMPTFITVK